MEERFGKEGVRQFIFALRRAVVGGVGEEVYQQAFRLTPEEFYREWKRWLVDKYKPYRDKEIPDDYSLDMSPDPRKPPPPLTSMRRPSGSMMVHAIFESGSGSSPRRLSSASTATGS